MGKKKKKKKLSRSPRATTKVTRDFRPRPGARLNRTQARKYGKRIYELADMGVEITPQSLLDDAKRKSSPLHDYVEWNDKAAAHMWRIEQMKYLSRSIEVIEVDDDEQEVIAPILISIPTGPETRQYIPTHEVMADPDFRQQAVLQAAHELRAAADKYEYMKELASLCRNIQGRVKTVIEAINKSRAKGPTSKRKKKVRIYRHTAG